MGERVSRVVNGVKHGNLCACPVCDPQQAHLAKVRADAVAARPVPIKVVGTPEGPAVLVKAMPRYRPQPSADTRRLAQLLRAGKTFAQAAEIIESEKTQQRKEPTP